jgi:hypothetical protein
MKLLTQILLAFVGFIVLGVFIPNVKTFVTGLPVLGDIADKIYSYINKVS